RKGVDAVVGTPGRLIDLLERRELSLRAVEVLVVDEADRMADLGFMPQVQKLLHRIESEHQTMLFSATLDGGVRQLVNRYMHDPVKHEVASPEATVDEMTHRFLHVHQMDKVKVAAAISRGVERTLVFVRTKRGADRLVTQFRREGVRAGAIHGDLRQGARERALADFSSGKLPVLVATDVAARGIHVDNVDVVVHYDPAEDEKAYLHRSGRTARAGEDVIGFGAGEPDYPTPEHIVVAAVEASRDPRNHRYSPTAGLPELRLAIAEKTRRESGVDCQASQVLVTNGAKHAVYEALQTIVDPGDEVLLPAPYWTTYPEAISLAGGEPVVVPT